MDALDGEGRTALHLAVGAGSAPIIEALCRSKVEPWSSHRVEVLHACSRIRWADTASMCKAVTFLLLWCTKVVGRTRHSAQLEAWWSGRFCMRLLQVTKVTRGTHML